MPSEELADFHHQLTADIELLLPAVERIEEEGIHQFRLCVKRLRAFYQWLEEQAPAFSAKEKASQVRAVFKAAGKVRDVQVQRRLASHWQESTRIPLDGYLNHLGGLENEQGQPLAQACRDFHRQTLVRRREEVAGILSGDGGKQALTALDEHLRQLVEQLQQMTQEVADAARPEASGDEPHRVRILTKRIRSAAEAALSAHPEEARLDALIESMKALHDPLGDWHDRRVAWRMAGDYLQAAPPESEGERLKLFIQSMREEETAFLDAFRENWQAFINSADNAMVAGA